MDKIKNKIKYLWRVFKLRLQLLKKTKRIFLFGTPFHSNMGDQAQTMCSIKWFQKNYPEYQIYTFDTKFVSSKNYRVLRMIKKSCKGDFKLFLHSGYHTTDLYLLEDNMQREVVRLFEDKCIVMLPQTILYQNKEEEEKAAKIYNNHKNLIMLCRDDFSYSTAQEIFSKVKLYKYPDIVTTLIGTKTFQEERNGILLCMRNDKEAFYSKEQIERLRKNLEGIDTVEITDTTIKEAPKYIEQNREKILNTIFKKYAKYKVIITDRYHGTIFSLIANTPVLVLSSTDHKLSSGVKWFPEQFKDYVCYVENIEQVKGKVEDIYQKEYKYQLPPYFNTEYYDKLKKIIEGE